MPVRSTQYMDERRDHIVAATLACFTRLGVVATSLSDICTQAGISRGALYTHFDSKEEILVEVIRKQREGRSGLAFGDFESLRASLKQTVRFVSAASQSAAGFVELELLVASRGSERVHEALQDAFAQSLDELGTAIESMAAAGQLKPGIAPREATQALHLFLMGLTTSAIAGLGSRESYDAGLDLLLRTLFSDG